jgi:hypothetical protein
LRLIIAILALLFACQGADAAKIELQMLGSGSGLVVVEGDIELADIDVFRLKVHSLKTATVAFQSDGGSLLAGIRIGSMIRLKGLITVVPDGAQCASACAVAWLGGSRRYVGTGARIGFHAAYIQSSGQASESGPGNAVLGAYLNQIGLSEDAIVYITQAAPASMKWMSLTEAGEHGIDVALLPPATAGQTATSGELVSRESPPGSPSRRATDFVLAILAKWTGPNKDALHTLDELYTEKVVYHGKWSSLQTVVQDKKRFAERWPERSYKIRPATLKTRCAEESELCRVSGVMDWELANAKAATRTRGVATFEYSVARSGNALKISAESTSLNEKQTPASAPNSLTSVRKSLQQLVAQIAKLSQSPAAKKEEATRPNAPVQR